MVKSINGADTIPDLLSSHTAQLASFANYELKATDFGVSTSNADNKTQIINALNQLKANGGGTLLFPFGVIKTSPISFQGYDNVVIKGVGRSVPYTITTTLQIVGTNPNGSVGLQFSDTTNPNPTWQSRFCKVEGLFLDCNYACDFGINGNLGLSMKDVMVRHANKDGIVMEDLTYPFFINQCFSEYNGRHGIYVKGPNTTSYSVYQSEFSYNTGYGIYLEGGALSGFKNCFSQSNARGGIKINYISGYSTSYYLENLEFDQVYTEANGTLATNDPNYEGNYTLVITGYDTTNSALLKPKNIKFLGVINASTQGKALKIDAAYGCFIDAPISGQIDIINGGVMGLEFATNPTSAAVPAIGSGQALTSYYNLTAPAGKIVNGLHLSSRGNVHTFMFVLPSISAGTTVRMNVPEYSSLSNVSHGIKMMRQGSILSVCLYKGNNNGTVTGTLSVRPKYADNTQPLFTDPTLNFTGFTDIVLQSTDIQQKGKYNPGQFGFNEDYLLGLEVTSSADYNAGYNTSLVGYIVVEF